MEEKISDHQNIYNQYLHYLKISGYKQTTRKHYRYAATEFLSWLQANHITTLESLSPEHIQQYYQYLSLRPNKTYPGTLSGRTVAYDLNAIQLLLNYCEQSGQIQKNPISGLVFPKPAYRHREPVRQEEIGQLYDATVTRRERALLGIYYGCGLRKSEGTRLNTSDIHYKDLLLYVRTGKGDKRRVVPMSEGVAKDFYDYCYEERDEYIKDRDCLPDAQGNPFMLNKRGGRMREMAANRMLARIIQRTGNKAIEAKKVCIHSLRHSIATHLLENGLSIEYVRDFLGHQKLETTQIYTKISKQQLLEMTIQ